MAHFTHFVVCACGTVVAAVGVLHKAAVVSAVLLVVAGAVEMQNERCHRGRTDWHSKLQHTWYVSMHA